MKSRIRTRKHTIVVALLTLAVLAATTVAAVDRDFLWQFDELTERKPFLRWFWHWDQRAYPGDEIPAGAFQQGLTQTHAHVAAQQAGTAGDTALQWTAIGPSPLLGGQIGRTGGTRDMAGRMTDVAVHPSDNDRWLVGGAQGGVWETRDAGATWTSLTHDQASLATGSIAFSQSDSNTIYVGTGEAGFSADGYDGAGLLKSVDGGETWSLVAASVFAEASFSDVKVDPSDPNVLLAATSRGIGGRGPTTPPNRPARGVFRSTDGGDTWVHHLDGNATDLEPDPTNFARIYAGIGEIFGNPLAIPPLDLPPAPPDTTAAGNGVYRSTDGGATWELVDGPLVPWENPPFSTRGAGRVELAIAPSNPDVLYVSIQDAITGEPTDAGLLGLWRTDNAWDATPIWTQISTAQIDGGTGGGYCGFNRAFASPQGQCWYDHEIIVDPTNVDVLYAGGIELWKYDGVVWTDVSQTLENPTGGIHVDQHSMAWAGSRLVVGNDGGIWSTPDDGATWTDHNDGLFTIQYYDGSAHPASIIALGGSQDNGSHLWSGVVEWDWIGSGDGADNAVSASDPDNDWAISSQFLNITKTVNGGATFTAADNGIDGDNAPFIGRFESCPGNAEVMIAGTDNLWRSDDFFDGGSNFTANGPEEGAGRPNQITGMAFAPSDDLCQTYAYGTGSGVIRVTADGGRTWADLDAGGMVPNRFVTDLAFDPTNANVLYVSLSGFDAVTPGAPGHLFKTTDALSGAASWADVSPPVDLPNNSVAVNPSAPSTVYVGTDVGVWLSEDGAATWEHSGPVDGMPNVAVFEVQTDAVGTRVFAFTHGRGALTSIGVDALLEVRPLAGSAAQSGDHGDGDAFVDNCESTSLSFEVENLGATDLSQVEAVRIESVSHPGTRILTPLPLPVSALLACGQTCGNAPSVVTASFQFLADGLAFDDELIFEIEVRGTAPSGATAGLGVARLRGSESDFEARASQTFDFEAGFDGWKIVSGTYTRNAPGANGTLTHLASAEAVSDQCDLIESPEIRLSAASTLSLYNQFQTEPGSPALGFYDRANIGLIDVLADDRTTIDPDGGRLYNANGPNGSCVTNGENGWADFGVPFAESTWSPGALQTGSLGGKRLRLSAAYGTDPLVSGVGFQLDEVTLTDFEIQVPDPQTDVCPTNLAPIAAADAASTLDGVPVEIDVLANDSDPDGDGLTVDSVTQGSNGGVATDGSTVTYTPDGGFTGVDGFTYEVCDDGSPSLCDVATVTVTVYPEAIDGRVHGSGHLNVNLDAGDDEDSDTDLDSDSDDDSDSDKVHFSFDAKYKDGELKGKLKLKDKELDLKIDAKTITSLSAGSGDCNGRPMGPTSWELTAEGTFERNDVETEGATFRVCGEDNGKPGKGNDRFYLECLSGCAYDSGSRVADDVIDGGNIHIHDPIQSAGGGGGAASAPPEGSAPSSSGSAATDVDIVELEPLLLDEQPAGTPRLFVATVHADDGPTLAAHEVTLTWTDPAGVKHAASALTDGLGVAVFSVAVPAGGSEFFATAGGVQSNGAYVVGVSAP